MSAAFLPYAVILMGRFLIVRGLKRAAIVGFLLGLIGVGVWPIGMYGLAEYHVRQARRALERQRYEPALKELESALRLYPRNAELHLLAGRTARQAGKYSISWDHLHRYRELHQGVSSDLQLEEYLLRAQTGELEEVFPFLSPYLAQDDAQTPLVLETLSHAYLFLFRFDNAQQCLERWLTLQPDNVQALFLQGSFYSLTDKIDRAAVALRRSLELDPERVPARLLLAQTLKDSHHIEEAVQEYEIALRQEPNNEKARLGLASCYVDLREWSKAEPLLQGYSADAVDGAEWSHLKGRIAEGQGQYAEAVPYFLAALNARPSDNVACYHLILCYQQLKDESSASKYQELLDRLQKDQGRLLIITNKEKEALLSNPDLCCELGEICLRLGIKRRGVHWLQAALQLNPRSRRAHEDLLHYYESLGPQGNKDAMFHSRMLRELAASKP